MVKLLLSSAAVIALVSSVTAAAVVVNNENVQAEVSVEESLIIPDAEMQVQKVKQNSLIGDLLDSIADLLRGLPGIVDDTGDLVDNIGDIIHISIGIGHDDDDDVNLLDRPRSALPPSAGSLVRPRPSSIIPPNRSSALPYRPTDLPNRPRPSEDRFEEPRHASAIRSVQHFAH